MHQPVIVRFRKVALLGCIVVAPAAAADHPSHVGLHQALAAHEAATDLAGEVAALEGLRTLDNPDHGGGLVAFWRAYLATQVGRLVKMQDETGDPMAYLDEAQGALDRAAASLTSPRERSSVLALQSLIHQLGAWFGGEGEGGPHQAQAREALDQAVAADPDNPVVFVFAGTALVSEGRAMGSKSRLLAAKLVLEEAQRRFSAETGDPSTTTAFNSEWIPFWLPRAEALLRGEDG